MNTERSILGRMLRWGMRLLLCVSAAGMVMLAVPAARAVAQENDQCFACHGEKSFTAERGGRTVSLFVDPKKFSGSVHAGLTCTSCHADLEGKELPHDAPLAHVQCGSCHDSEQKQHAESLHGKALAHGDKLAPDCKDCHGMHDIIPVKNPLSA